MPAISVSAFAVWRPMLSLAGAQKHSECQSKTAQIEKPGLLLREFGPAGRGRP